MRVKSIKHSSVNRVPRRSCVACREVKDKNALIRLVRLSDGSIDVNASNKKTGRGAYLCPTQVCWDMGIRSGKLERSLKVAITQDNREQLIRLGKEFIKDQINGEGK